MKQAIYIFCLYIGVATFLTLTLFRNSIEINMTVSIIAALVIAGMLLLLSRKSNAGYGNY
ncbi:MAG: hypothetical protein A4E28_02393 [Methanocella sp. PtaU1.Bin125]|nr:MAG: hypothetical protein A4E28_02393 [Methanocella sp. PtaU1.Bin125]